MNQPTAQEPLVSIGVPTYNRPELLRRALTRLTAQSYRNLEIVVSDNASPGEETARVVAEFTASDQRVSYVRQPLNRGPLHNFFSVFGKCNGELFMWAADDDQWEPWFVEKCVEMLRQNPHCCAAITEVQYVGEEGSYPFFPEGRAFYHGSPSGDRLTHLLLNNYGNLVYSLFRRSALLTGGRLFWEVAQLETYNEIPLLLWAAYRGGFVVAPEIGMYKGVPENVYRQAKWEFTGGRLHPACRVKSFKVLLMTAQYHVACYRDIERGVRLLNLEAAAQKALLRRAGLNLFKHFICLSLGYRPFAR